MAGLDIFKQDPFRMIQLTASVEKVPYIPDGLEAMGIFQDAPIRTEELWVEQRQGQLVLVPFSDRGAPGTQRTTEQRQARAFKVPRIRMEDTITARELAGIREFGSETELMQVQKELARRLVGPTGLRQNLRYTQEYQRLAAVQGQLLDSDGSVKYNWFTEFGITPNDTVYFDLAAKTVGSLRPICNEIVRGMKRKAQGAFISTTKVQALVGDTFWDLLVTHPDVEKTYLNWQEAQELRNGTAFGFFTFGGIDWSNYRGSDDNSTIAIGAADAVFFPKGAPGIFQRGLSPHDSFEWVNTLGKPEYVQIIPDRDRNEWAKAEMTAYPLHICTRPEVLYTGSDAASA